jgi:hypothetical protein
MSLPIKQTSANILNSFKRKLYLVNLMEQKYSDSRAVICRNAVKVNVAVSV